MKAAEIERCLNFHKLLKYNLQCSSGFKKNTGKLSNTRVDAHTLKKTTTTSNTKQTPSKSTVRYGIGVTKTNLLSGSGVLCMEQ